MVNALALPGGQVVVFRGLLQKTNNPDELAGVLAHELQHVFRRHTTQAMLRTLSTRALVSALGAQGETMLSQAEFLGSLRFSRNVEAEADREGLALMLAARLDGRKMIDAFRMLQRSAPGAPSALYFLSDHPRTEERIQTLEKLLPKVPEAAAPIELDEPWSSTIARCHQR